MGIMISCLHICGSVHDDQLWLYISRSLHIDELPKCVNILFVTPSGLETSCGFFQLGVLFESRLVSDTLVCDPIWSLSLPLSLFRYCFSLVFHIDWDVTYIFVVVRYSPVCQSPYHQSLPRCCNSLNVLLIQLFD